MTPMCDCGVPQPYLDCCGRYHADPLHLQAPSAEALMRSRYSAFVRDLTAYLLATWHPSARPATLEPNPEGLRWLGLEVRRCSEQDPDHATVEFVARSKLGGRAQRLHETSRFVREGGRWFYVDGEIG
jgi:SEC-C motif-containing protein